MENTYQDITRIEVYDGNSPDGVIATKQSASGQLETKKLLHKKYVENMG